MNFQGNSLTAESLALLKGLMSSPLAKAGWSQPGSAVSGINNYDLEPRALQLFPVLTPLRNRTPRSKANGGIQANWRAVTGINTGHLSPGVSEGARNAAVTHATQDYFAAYRTMGFDDYVTEEAVQAAMGFDDARALAVDNLLRGSMIAEEQVLLGGNTSLPLGTTPTPTLAAATTGGTLATQTLSVICVALAMSGYRQVAGVNNGTVGEQTNVATATLTAQISRTSFGPYGGTTTYGGGVGQKSANATVAITGPTGSCGATVADVAGAFAYAWFWGAAGSEVLGAVTTINSVSITATAAGTFAASALPATDYSTTAYEYDGLLTQCSKSSLNAYYKVQANGTPGTGTPLTSDSAGGIVEVNNAFASFWNLYRLSPQIIYCHAQEMINMNAKVVAGGGAPLYRFNMDAKGGTDVVGGQVLGGLMNKITGQLVKVEVHPNLPPGTILFFSDSIPYPISGVRQLLTVRCRYDYRAYDWPMVARQYEYGVYWDSVLQNYFPPAFGVLKNIANG